MNLNGIDCAPFSSGHGLGCRNKTINVTLERLDIQYVRVDHVFYDQDWSSCIEPCYFNVCFERIWVITGPESMPLINISAVPLPNQDCLMPAMTEDIAPDVQTKRLKRSNIFDRVFEHCNIIVVKVDNYILRSIHIAV